MILSAVLMLPVKLITNTTNTSCPLWWRAWKPTVSFILSIHGAGAVLRSCLLGFTKLPVIQTHFRLETAPKDVTTSILHLLAAQWLSPRHAFQGFLGFCASSQDDLQYFLDYVPAISVLAAPDAVVTVAHHLLAPAKISTRMRFDGGFMAPCVPKLYGLQTRHGMESVRHAGSCNKREVKSDNLLKTVS